MWLLIEVNLVSASIFDFAELFKVLPKYSIYSRYCQSSNAMNSTTVVKRNNIHNASALGIIFFNLPSIFVGILADMFGGRFVKLII
ncbi:unnamed protein product, partial [Adineta steineri]